MLSKGTKLHKGFIQHSEHSELHSVVKLYRGTEEHTEMSFTENLISLALHTVM